MGPITIFDKSFLEALNIDEAVWFDNFYRTNIKSLFFAETLADLEKKMAAGRTQEEIVGSIAYRTPVLHSSSQPLRSEPDSEFIVSGVTLEATSRAGQDARTHR